MPGPEIEADDIVAKPVIKTPDCGGLTSIFKKECSMREVLVQNTGIGQKVGGYAEIDADTTLNGRKISQQPSPSKGPG